MSTQVIISGMVLGLVSSFHCIGMCGPLSLALPIGNRTKSRKALSLVLYHMGRVLVYAGFGLLFGLLGRQIYLAGFQRWFSISMGIFMIFLVLQYFVFRKGLEPRFMTRYYKKIQGWIFYLWRRPSGSGLFLLGMANGLLPCGMVYFAVAGALSLPNVGQSVAFMTAFGLGTLPALIGVRYIGSSITLPVRKKMRNLVPYVMATMGLMLILRGLNLGIPYISPLLETSRAAIDCH